MLSVYKPAPHKPESHEEVKPPFPYDSTPPAKPDTHVADEKPVTPPPKKPTDSKPAQTISNPPKSPSDDPDPLKTVYCTKSSSASKDLVQYALMIDAGSQGSRIHVYKFNNCGESSMLEYEVFEQTRPGLSAYAEDPLLAAESLDVLMDVALKTVPASLQSCTPVAVKATAGLRLLGKAASDKILKSVEHRLKDKYPFTLPGEDPVAIMDGKDEGVFAWITVNYLLKTIGNHVASDTPSYATLDLGGASTQIVFEPTFAPSSKDKLAEGDHKYELKFSGKTHTLYQHSYLGFGTMRARQSVHNLVAFMGEFGHPDAANKISKGEEVIMPNPCIAAGEKRVVEIDSVGWRERGNITMVGEDVGSYTACNRIIELIMAKDAICNVKPCSFNGAYQPSILDTFPKGGILTLSYFYDRISPLVPEGTSTLPISEIALLAQRVCAGKSSWKEHWGTNKLAMEELEGRPEHCLDLTFQHALLRLGYEFSDEREVRIEKKIDGVELGWALGAGIAMLDATLTCRA